MNDDPFSTQLSDQPVLSRDPDEAVAMPQHIGRFRIERILGQGGFGVVYLGHDDQLQRKVAIKVPKPQFVQRAEDRELYLKEARTVAGLEHPNIVPVHEVGSTPEFPIYIVSKFIVGKNLAAHLKSATPMYRQAVLWMIDLADALREAHRKGFVHRDVKPQNILVDQDGRVYLVDFGLALADQDVGKRLPAGGTPAYMSPEQARGEGHRVDGRSDLFSLGILFYEMLSGRRPFQGNSYLELYEQITDLDPKPLRQWVDSVPQELERICFKMLAKRKSERYSSARDLADDLKVFLTKSPSDLQPMESIRHPDAIRTSSIITKGANADATPMAVTPTSGSRTLKIVPKGLRSFDHRDADFFLELLPGARDRDGLPESIGFWKSRIEERDADQTFAVGLVYGPSGCGKSSMMKAGLLPRLASDIVPIYLEASVDDTEQTLLTLIRRKLDSKEAETTKCLVDLLHEIRRGRILPRGKKLLIVIDQFEQWLFDHPNTAGEPLLESLLQCDGLRVQAIVMVRDDFWMAATRFFRDLDIPLVERNNSAAVDLFSINHAERVLKAFGRAFGTLESDGKEDEQDHKQFITDSVLGLSEDGKVISVRLSLFAEMMKGRPWTTESLREVGGTTGVGAKFLEETFSASGAPPHHRYHQEAARSVLRLLLPAAGTDIKGHKRSTDELRTACKYYSRQRDFEDLVRILDGELRLITPVDSTEPQTLATTAKAIPSTLTQLVPATQYQLTHDYLVPSLRDWLTRKQRETPRGRAELKLAERAYAWNALRENKQLPTLWEWLSIRTWTDQKQSTGPQRAMIQKANRFHLLRLSISALILGLTSFGVWTWNRFQNELQLERIAAESRLKTEQANVAVAELKARKNHYLRQRTEFDKLLMEKPQGWLARARDSLDRIDAAVVDFADTVWRQSSRLQLELEQELVQVAPEDENPLFPPGQIHFSESGNFAVVSQIRDAAFMHLKMQLYDTVTKQVVKSFPLNTTQATIGKIYNFFRTGASAKHDGTADIIVSEALDSVFALTKSGSLAIWKLTGEATEPRVIQVGDKPSPAQLVLDAHGRRIFVIRHGLVQLWHLDDQKFEPQQEWEIGSHVGDAIWDPTTERLFVAIGHALLIINTKAPKEKIVELTLPAERICLQPKDRLIVCAGDRTCTFLDPDSLVQLNRLQLITEDMPEAEITDLSMSSDGAFLAICIRLGDEHSAELWSLVGGQRLGRIPNSDQDQPGFQFKPASYILAMLGKSGLSWWTVDGADTGGQLGMQASPIRDASWSKDGKRVLISRKDSVGSWNYQGLQFNRDALIEVDGNARVQVSPSGERGFANRMISGGTGYTLPWEVKDTNSQFGRTQKRVIRTSIFDSSDENYIYAVTPPEQKGVLFSPDNIKRFSLADWKEHAAWNDSGQADILTGRGNVGCLESAPNTLFAGLRNGSVRRLTADLSKLTATAEVFSDLSGVSALASSPLLFDWLAVGSVTGKIAILDAQSLALKEYLEPHSGSCTSLFWLTETEVVSTGSDGVMKCFRLGEKTQEAWRIHFESGILKAGRAGEKLFVLVEGERAIRSYDWSLFTSEKPK